MTDGLLYSVLFLVFVLSFAKYLNMLLLSFPLYLFNKRQKRSITRGDRVEPDSAIDTSMQEDVKKGILQEIKDKIYVFLIGYSKYYIHHLRYIPSHVIRNFVYTRILLINKHPQSVIYYGTEFRASYNVEIGKSSIIGDNCLVDARQGGVFIGENVNIGSEVRLWTDSHDMNDPYFRSLPGKRGPIRIGDRAWLSAGCTILHNVTIGEGAVVAASAVVTKDVEPYTVVGGIPAEKIGERNKDLKYSLDGFTPFY